MLSAYAPCHIVSSQACFEQLSNLQSIPRTWMIIAVRTAGIYIWLEAGVTQKHVPIYSFDQLMRLALRHVHMHMHCRMSSHAWL